MSKLKSMVMIVMTASIFFGGGYVLAQDQPTPRDWMQGRFDAMDTDKDGEISRDEYTTYKQARAEKKFQMLDSNGDGFVTQEEYQEGMRKYKEKKRQRWMQKGSAG